MSIISPIIGLPAKKKRNSSHKLEDDPLYLIMSGLKSNDLKVMWWKCQGVINKEKKKKKPNKERIQLMKKSQAIIKDITEKRRLAKKK